MALAYALIATIKRLRENTMYSQQYCIYSVAFVLMKAHDGVTVANIRKYYYTKMSVLIVCTGHLFDKPAT